LNSSLRSVPGYITLVDNIRHVLLAPGSMALAEVEFLLADEVREPRAYLATSRSSARRRVRAAAIPAKMNDVIDASAARDVSWSRFFCPSGS
jgi:hypothetical protein